jgi:predicted transcriptional regulator
MTSKTETIEVDVETASALRERAARRGVSVSELIAELVPLSDEDESIAELDRRWAEIEAGEPTVPHEEVERWLRTWGTPEFRPWPTR